jgi:phosphatidylglycerophosphate synthase
MIENLNQKSQVLRAKWLKPLYQLLTAVGATPNGLTFIRFLAGPVFFLYFPVYPRKMTLLLLIASAMDWVDGGLARYQGKDSDRGKFWDVLVDYLNYAFAILALLSTQAFDSVLMAYQLLIAPVCYLLAVLKESEGKKTDWIIHPYYSIIFFKPLALAALLLYVIWGINIINLTVLFLNVVMTVQAFYYVITLAQRWKGK